MFNIAKKLGWEIFWDSVKFTWDSTFVDALGPRDAIEIKPKSNTGRGTTFRASDFFQGCWAEVTHEAKNGGSFSAMMGPSI